MGVDEAALDAFLASDGDETVETAAPETAESSAPETETDPLPEGDKFDRAYVEKLRKEAAGYRERAKKYASAFDGYEEDAVSEWLELAEGLKNDPRTTAQRFKEIYEAIEAQYQEDLEEAKEEVETATGEDRPLTRSEVEKLLSDRERELDIQKRVATIEVQAKELGYEPGSEDYDELLWMASRTKSGDIKEAHEKLQARYQAYFDRQVDEVGKRPNPMISTGNPPASGERKLSTFDDASKALDEWLASQ